MNHDAQPNAHEESTVALLDDPDIRNLYDLCLSTNFKDETTYLQGILALVHACDLAYQDKNAGHEWETVKDVSLCLINIHLEKQNYAFCHGELDFLLSHYADHENGELPEDVEAALTRVCGVLNGNFADFYEECPVSAKLLLS